ncbi:MAG: RagB/SusD family nutrient uptake outer membrane protein [Saprospiraceae bacterium]
MSKYKIFFNSCFILFCLITLVNCKKDFLEKPPTDSITDASFYKTNEQVLSATAALYNKVWFDYNDKASYNLGDFRAGTAFSAYNDRGNVLFNTTGVTPENGFAWRSFFVVVAQANLFIQNVNRYAGAEVTPDIKKHAIAEARFMRALAYRFLVMNWGDVPVIENNQVLLADTSISRNTVKSVWRFITREMRACENDLLEIPTHPGRLTKWSARAMLARFYLNRAGVEAAGTTRNQTFLDSAKYYSKLVIDNGPYALQKNYEDLFKFPYDNNTESIFSLQWVYTSPTAWGTQNSSPAYLAYSADIANGDGWGGDKSATWWMIKMYEGLEDVNKMDTLIKGKTLDQRLHATFMMPGSRYPEITQSLYNPAGEQKLIYSPANDAQRVFLAIKKYVCGKAKDMNGEAASQRYGYDTYMMRLSELYLIYAEAALGNSASTADATTLTYFNKVHTRSGLPPVLATDPVTGAATPLTFDKIFKERMLEFSMEGMAWYDFVSLHYWNPQKAYDLLNEQDREVFYCIPNKSPEPDFWEIRKTPWLTANRKINANSGNFLLPIPSAEISQAPNLQKPAVDYP